MISSSFKLIELFVIFILIPVSYVVDYSPLIKLIVGVFGFVYILFVMFKVENIKISIQKNIEWNKFWKTIFLKFLIIAIGSAVFVWFTDKESLFNVLLNKPLLWILILFFYSVFSVYPQELLYRTFFFKRYKTLFKNEAVFIFMNAILFSLAHLFFKNTMVTVITFIGGILFSLTYKKTKSTLLVSIEHAIYGCWLFTVGMGNMLGFPS